MSFIVRSLFPSFKNAWLAYNTSTQLCGGVYDFDIDPIYTGQISIALLVNSSLKVSIYLLLEN